MKIFKLIIIYFFFKVAICTAANTQTTAPELIIGGKQLSLQLNIKCALSRPSGKILAQYLSQYDPSEEPRSDILDETPWSADEKKIIQDTLIMDGFHYPDGQESIITWMDFDGDGICDFTASAGVGGMRSIDRMFLFRGLPNGKFKLIDYYIAYMANSSILVPYIPIKIIGEKFPILVKGYLIMQWESDRKQFMTCETLLNSDGIKKKIFDASKKSNALLIALCPHAQDIYKWAVDQLPQKNELAY